MSSDVQSHKLLEVSPTIERAWRQIMARRARHHVPSRRQIANLLDLCMREFHLSEWIVTDPLALVRPFGRTYEDAAQKAAVGVQRSAVETEVALRDLEVVALLASQLAYGNVKLILGAVERALFILATLDPSPSQAVIENQDQLGAAFGNWKYRFQLGCDLVLLFEMIRRSWKEYGSLGQHVWEGQRSLSRGNENSDLTIQGGLEFLLRDWRQWSAESSVPRSPGFAHFLASPEGGSACKRWCMFLRWMVRRDTKVSQIGDTSESRLDAAPVSQTEVSPNRGSPSVDIGAWQCFGFVPSLLVMPLDTHTAKVSRILGLTVRANVDWRAALEVTQSLRRYCKEDPVKFDFALCRVGMMGLLRESE